MAGKITKVKVEQIEAALSAYRDSNQGRVTTQNFPNLIEIIKIGLREHSVCREKQDVEIEPINLGGLTFECPFNTIEISKQLGSTELTLPPLVLNGSQFNHPFDLTGATILGDISFYGTQFNVPVKLEKCTFKGNVNFTSVTSFKSFDCTGARFEKISDFRHTVFRDWTTFNQAEFRDIAYFEGCDFHGGVDFSKTEFFSASFNDSHFMRNSFFSGAEFTKWAPRFHNADLHPDMSFEGATFLAFDHEQDWRAYRTLKQHMANVKAQEEESFFFACEQRSRRRFISTTRPTFTSQLKDLKLMRALDVAWQPCKRIHDNRAVAHSSGNNFISLLYDYLSAYGQSITRPLYWWVLQLIAFWYVFLGRMESIETSSKWVTSVTYQGPIKAAFLSLNNSLNPLAIFAREPAIYPIKALIAFLSMGQSIISLTLIALTLLAIRRRFHKGSE
ncbi:MAG: pentapeptide repeat-containing protein [Burkholderiales bacterium]